MSERHHFLIPSDNINRNRFELSESESHHLNHVVGLRKGDEIFLLDRQGDAYRGTIDKVEAGIISGFISESIKQYHESTTRLHLGVGILKGAKMDIVVEKCTELGMFSVTPLIMKHNVKNTIRLERVRRIAESTVKQCGRGHIPAILEPTLFENWCSTLVPEHSAVTDNVNPTIPIWEWLKSYSQDFHDIWLTVGPEGGYHKEEQKLIREIGVPIVSLGPRRLKSETAAIAAVAICDNYFQ